MNKVENFDGITIESHNNCSCSYLDDTANCYNILHVWFILNMEDYALFYNENYVLYKNNDLEFYSKKFLDEWLSLNYISYSYRTHYLNMKKYKYDRFRKFLSL